MGVVATFVCVVWVAVVGASAGVVIPVLFGAYGLSSIEPAVCAGLLSLCFTDGVVGAAGALLLPLVGPIGPAVVGSVYAVWKYGARGWYGVEAAVIAVYVARSGFEAATTHLTWWGMGLLGVYDVCRVAGVRAGGCALAVVCSTVTCGVIAMSIMGCDLLIDSHTDYGAVRYVAGNWAVHYYPLTRVLFDYREWTGSPLPGVGVVAAYAVLREPGLVYGCFSLSAVVIRTMLVSASLVLAGACAYFRSWRVRTRGEF